MCARKVLIHGGVTGCLILLLLACNQRPSKSTSSEPETMHDTMPHEVIPVAAKSEAAAFNKAVCVLNPTKGNKVTGLVTFTQSDSGMVVVAHLEGLTPGKHGFHIHEYGDCSSPDASSAGGHFNPGKDEHGAPHSEKRHIGDLGNVEAGQDGKVDYQILDPVMSFSGENSVLGRAVIVHAGEDDLQTQPSGNSGARVACGVIGIAK